MPEVVFKYVSDIQLVTERLFKSSAPHVILIY